MGTLRFFEEVVSFKIRRTFGFADYTNPLFNRRPQDISDLFNNRNNSVVRKLSRLFNIYKHFIKTFST